MQLSICTYNCNGLAKIRQHAPDVSHAGILQQLGADIVCFQETKMSHADLWPLAFKRIADVPGWDSYFCFTRKGSYSGVATYCRTAVTTVRAAEEGLLRVLPPQNPVCAAVQHVVAGAGATAASDLQPAGATADNAATQQQVPPAAGAAGEARHCAAASSSQHQDLPVRAAPWPSEIVFPEPELRTMFSAEEALAVDKDGRCIITDHGLFVLFHCYFPACSGNNGLEQIEVKRNMWRVVDVRMRALLAAGRHVVLAGDFNVVLPWWGQHNILRGSGLEKRAASINRLAASQDAMPSQQQPVQQQSQSQDLQGQGSLALQGSMDAADASGIPDASLVMQEQQQQEAGEPQQAQELPVALQLSAKEDNFAPHAQFRRGKPVLPSSGTAEWLIRLTTPPNDTQGISAQQTETQPTAGVLVDTTKALNPGVKLFRYPDAKKPGRFKERPPNTNWSQFHGIRNDQHGARGDYIFVADAADYAVKAQKLKQQQECLADPPPAHQQQQPPAMYPLLQRPQQQPSPQTGQIQQPALQEAFSISLLSALSSAFILRELRWTDHAPVVLQLQLPAKAAQLLRSPAADAALQTARSSTQQHQETQPEPLRNSSIPQEASSAPMQPTSSIASLLAAGPSCNTAAAAGADAGLPCPLSSWWITQPEVAAATAAAVLAAAGVARVPVEVLTCSVVEQLRRSQYAAATEIIAACARQLYVSEDAEAAPVRQLYVSEAQAHAGIAAAADESGVRSGVEAAKAEGSRHAHSQPMAELPHSASQHLQRPSQSFQPAAATVILPAPPPAAATASAAAAAPGSGAPGAAIGQQQPASQQGAYQAAGKQPKPRWWAQQRHAKQQRAAAGRKQGSQPAPPVTPAVGSKRKSRGWKVVSIGNGCTATVACSSSDDSD